MTTSDDPTASPEPVAEAAIPVVGIGSSAGGIQALTTLVPHLPVDMGLAYVVVQHLAADQQSSLASILSRLTPMPVVEIADGTDVLPDRIHVIPPNVSLTLTEDRFHLDPPVEQQGRRLPIDGFFASVAAARGEDAVGIVLSGTGSDGTLGLRAIREHDGLTLAQADAEYDGMMRSAVQSGAVDAVLPLAEIGPRLRSHFRHLAEPGARRRFREMPLSAEQVTQICALVRARTGHDFSGYKDRTMARRIQRRMQVLQIEDITQFIERLRKDPQESEALLQDLLIGVTSFFRDPSAFEVLERVAIPRLFEGKGPADTVRVWIPACSTGEEAYSIAILLREYQSSLGLRAPKLLIFASDIDQESLQIARLGRYPSTIAGDIPRARLERHFVREDGTFRVASDLREICLFSSHNVLHDAPFSKLDLVACRNLLIYLTTELQNRLIPLFHYALNDGGFLFLGTSENVSRHARLFTTVDKPGRLFQRRAQAERRLPEFPLTPVDVSRRRTAGPWRTQSPNEPLQALAERQLLERYSPPYVVIDAEGDLLYGSARTGKYLELAPGTPRIDIFSMARPGLRPDLRAAVHRAVSSGEAATQRNVTVGTNGGRQSFDLTVHPIRPSGAADMLYMVVFQDTGPIAKIDSQAEAAEDPESASLRHLESELRATRERLQATAEELESSNEELKSGNEELSSMNEELQSANEELETSKEELQSINEELQTVNAELHARVEELSRANSDIANLLESTQIATVFLDRDLAIKSFTPAAKDLFRLVESDAGRPITHVRARFQADTVQEDAERVLRTLATIERQVKSNDGETRYVMRMMPYRTVENVIAGVVVTFADITRISAAEERIGELSTDLRKRVRSLETLLDLLPVGILVTEDGSTEKLRVNRYGARMLGQADGGADGTGLRPLPSLPRVFRGDRELEEGQHPLQRAARTGRPVPGFEGHLLRADASRLDVMMSATPLLNDGPDARGAIAAMLDISELRAAEAHQQILVHELQHRVKNIITTIGALASRMIKESASLDDFAKAFLGRLRAMATTHELLSRGNWTGADLGSLAEATLQSYLGRDRHGVSLQGPALVLTPNTAATLGMVLFELATNATKYGALAHDGRIDLSWRLDGETVTVEWTETGGVAIEGPFKEGFGTGFVRRSVEYELSGSAEVRLGPAGLRWTIRFPAERNLQPPAAGVTAST